MLCENNDALKFSVEVSFKHFLLFNFGLLLDLKSFGGSNAFNHNVLLQFQLLSISINPLFIESFIT